MTTTGENSVTLDTQDRTTFLEQRAEAMQRWADYLGRLVEGGAKVVPIGARRA